MPPRFSLYYWPIPFRGQFPRYIMAYAGVAWDAPPPEAVRKMYRAKIDDQPVPFMGLPVLHDRETDTWLSQMPAICGYLGQALGLLPSPAAQAARSLKILGDCADVLEGLTRHCGAQMWTDEAWHRYAEDRLARWLHIFESTARQNGIRADAGTILGTDSPGVADLACAALWITIWDKLPALRPILEGNAPRVMALSHRIGETAAIAELRRQQQAQWGDAWCGGEIERSLRSVLARSAG